MATSSHVDNRPARDTFTPDPTPTGSEVIRLTIDVDTTRLTPHAPNDAVGPGGATHNGAHAQPGIAGCGGRLMDQAGARPCPGTHRRTDPLVDGGWRRASATPLVLHGEVVLFVVEFGVTPLHH